MRWTILGAFVLSFVCALPSAALAQASGEVQAIGFNGTFRPDAWVPMIVRLKPDRVDAGSYQIRVYQHDLDGDRAVYVKPITLNGASTAAVQSFWMYFLPEPIHRGLPDQTGGTMHDLQKDLVVFLCDAKGKQLVQLPLTSVLNNVDPWRDPGTARARASKLVLAVSANGSQQMPLGDIQVAVGLMQDVEVVNLRVRELPENPLGYEPVDAVVWLDGDPADLDLGGAHGLSALQDYIRFGGQLIVTQPTQDWQQTQSFGDLLPVDVQGVASKPTFEPLLGMAIPPDNTEVGDATGQWARVRPPFLMARATPRAGAVVERWIDWRADGVNLDATPYLARRAAGLGQVTWVAQPLTMDSQPSNAAGWPYVWAQVFGWRSDAFVPPPPVSATSQDDPLVRDRKGRYEHGVPVDLGAPLMSGQLLNLGSKGAWLIVLAIGFFVVYWLAAGPGTYAYLVAKKRQGLSWFFFAVAALVATGVTVGVVKLVLRGPPEVRHLSMVRIAPGQPAIVYTRFGLYIPRDGDQTIELQGMAPGQLSYVSALAEHPQHLGDNGDSPAPLDYEVPVREMATQEGPSLTVPYRSSLKKFQARWVGDLPAKIGAGGLALDLDNGRLPLKGTLTNDTGLDLTDVYLAFHVKDDHDWMVYLPTWAKGTQLTLNRDFGKQSALVGHGSPQVGEPGDQRVLSDEVASPGARLDGSVHGWENFWFGHFRGGSGDEMEHDYGGVGLVFPMLSVLDRLPPMPNLPTGNYKKSDPEFDVKRAEFFARGGRMLDAGPSLSAGQLLVLATAKGPLPIPVQVDGDRMAGQGITLYQFLLPIDRGNIDKPTTQPAEGK